jgi:hypothetical protein
MSLETNVQSLLHAFEQGAAAVWLRRAMVATIIAAIAAIWLFVKFNGFNTPEAMDQAQIGRQIASGQGYTTLYARPLALNVMLQRTGQIKLPLPDVSQAPLGPLINAAVLKISGTEIAMPAREVVAPAERVIAVVSTLFFAGALIFCFLLGSRLFGAQLALIGTGMLIATDIFWRFSFSGLPQMPMLFFFSVALWLLAAALDANGAGRRIKSVLLAGLSAFLLGIVTLGHGIGLWIFAGFWIFSVGVLRPRWLVALTAPLLYALPVVPWALHNWREVRNPFGLPFYELARTRDTDPLAFTANFEPLLQFRWEEILQNTLTQTLSQVANFTAYIGFNIVAAAFFLALFVHTYNRWQPAQFRWAILFMWIGATAGMSLFGVQDEVSANQLHVLFLPAMVYYGLAFLLGLWNRLEFPQPVMRMAFIGLLYLIVAAPLALSLGTTKNRTNWPPYLPPLIERFSQWIDAREAMASDIPWATAWYAGRVSLLLPESIEQFELIHSERLLGAPIVAIYLTPYSGNRRTYADIVNGNYREWARFVLREIKQDEIRDWIIRAAVSLPVDGEAIMFADRVRWR